MKKRAVDLGILVAVIFVFAALASANLVSAQCGNYFKTSYSAATASLIGYFPDPGRLALDDWTGDGRSDFWGFRLTSGGFPLQIVIYPSQPSGYWDWNNPIVYTTTINNFGYYYKVADFDADGRTDLVFGEHSFQILHNNGNGTMTTRPAFTDTTGTLSSQATLDFVDVNGDNLLDWVYFIYFGSSPNLTSALRYKSQNPDGSFASQSTILASSAANGLQNSIKALGDFNGDDKIDIVYSTVTIDGTNKYLLLKNLGSGTFELGTPVTSDLYGPTKTTGAVRDFNNDSKDDVFSRGIMFYGRTDGTFDRAPVSSTNSLYAVAELNGDSNPDIIEFGSTTYTAHINNGAGAFTGTVYPKNFELAAGFKFEDFSGDGKADLYEIRSNQADNFNVFGEWLVAIKKNVCDPPYGETKLANFDGNSNADITTWNPANGNWSSKNARWSTAADPSARVFNWGLGALGDVPAPGDFDGDGKTDYSVYRSTTGVWYILKSSDSTWLTVQFGLTGDVAVPNDYDGGGRSDIAVWRPSDGNWYFWFTETQTFGAVHFGATGDRAVPADYDGDARTDVGIYRPSDGNWYYLKSSDNSYVVLHWGIASDVPVPADYDGDRKADLTIFRDGFWWVWRSSNNAVTVAQWGQPGDVPVPVYRNSVSADFGLYRPSNNLWYSFDNRGAQGVPVGGSGAAPVYFGLPNN